MMFARILDRVISDGSVTIVDARGRRHEIGSGPEEVRVRLTDAAIARRLAVNPYLHIGEAYMDGRLIIERGTLYDFLTLCYRDQARAYGGLVGTSWRLISRALRFLHQSNPAPRARQNAAHHYDLSDTLYDLFLDRDRQYSCAYFTRPHDDLYKAQEDKKRHIATKLLLAPGQRVLDVGSGWGGLALHLARAGAGEVLGISLAERQVEASRRRARRAGLDGRVRFELRDYRELDGRFDRIVSVGMFEHVGVRHYRRFFERLRTLLSDDGVALVHSIGRHDGPGATNPWMRKYIFPGGYAPALSEVLPAIERAGLWVTDIEILRLHYARTLRLWRQRFEANRARIEAMYDARFGRMWEFYLVGSELAFRHGGHMVFQIQLARRQDVVPLTRNYMLGDVRDANARSAAGGSARAA